MNIIILDLDPDPWVGTCKDLVLDPMHGYVSGSEFLLDPKIDFILALVGTGEFGYLDSQILFCNPIVKCYVYKPDYD